LPQLQPVRPPAGWEQAGAQRVELWLTTATSLERTICGKIGTPLVKKAKHSPFGVDHATHVKKLCSTL
jgi:hypothetical protein